MNNINLVQKYISNSQFIRFGFFLFTLSILNLIDCIYCIDCIDFVDYFLIDFVLFNL